MQFPAALKILAVSPDGKRIAGVLNKREPILVAFELANPYQSAVQRPIEHRDRIEGIDEIAWSPDGTRLAVRCGNRLAIVDPATLAPIESFLLDNAKIPPRVATVTRTVWMPDGRLFVVGTQFDGQNGNRPAPAAWVFDLRGAPKR